MKILSRGLFPLAVLAAAPAFAGPTQEGRTEAEVETAPPEVVERLLGEHGDAVKGKDAITLAGVLSQMAAYDNAEFLDPATKALKYRASKVDKAAAKAEAKELGILSRKEVEALVFDRESAVQVAATRVLVHHGEEPRTGLSLLKALQTKGVPEHKPAAAAAFIDAMGRIGFDGAQKEVFKEYKRFGDKEVQRACVRYFGQVKTKDKGIVRTLCEALEAPQPANVDAASNPPASYWENRWKKWSYVRRDVSWSLQQITGQVFKPSEGGQPSDSKKALDYVREHARELGIR